MTNASEGRVHILDEGVANQIAAGEVVERPASVLKELLENSIDASALDISVELQQGGVGLIRVRDDGTGIHPDDLHLALTRHGTSKLKRLEDLEQLTTRGFRGEALPSIGSVSRLIVRSRVAASATGFEVRVSGDAPQAPVPVAMQVGTEVEVRDLFFNTPARRRFLKTERTELGHLEAVLRNAALAVPGVGFRARHGDRRLLSVRSGTQEPFERLGAVLGQAFSRNLVPVNSAAGGFRLSGWVMEPEAALTTAPPQHFFLNGRPVRDGGVRHALGVAYETLLPLGTQAGYVLYLEMTPSEVDVNVHPAKTEVRFHDARGVHDFVMVAVRRALAAQGSGAVASGASSELSDPHPIPAPGQGLPGAQLQPRTLSVTAAKAAVRDSERLYGGRAGTGVVSRKGELASVPAGVLLERKFFLMERQEGLHLIDIRAALASAAVEIFGEALGGLPLVSRPLLLPPTIDVPPENAVCLGSHKPSLEQLGLIIKPVGETRWTLRQVPRCLRHLDPRAVMEGVLRAAGGGSLNLDPLCEMAGGALSPSDRELKADVAEAVGVLTRDGGGPRLPWGKVLDVQTVSEWLEASGLEE